MFAEKQAKEKEERIAELEESLRGTSLLVSGGRERGREGGRREGGRGEGGGGCRCVICLDLSSSSGEKA